MSKNVNLQLNWPNLVRNMAKYEQKTEYLIRMDIDLVSWNEHMTYRNTTKQY